MRATMPGQEWVQAIVTVGGGKGFVVENDRQRLIVTAGHCLPQLPPSFPGSYIEEPTFVKLVAPNGEEPAISAECLFVDTIADLAVLCEPDGQELYEECMAYE